MKRIQEETPKPTAEATPSASNAEGSKDFASSQTRQTITDHVSRRVQKPVPKAQMEDPRAFQLNQVRRRYKPEESEQNGTTVLSLKIVPSDPDFPFDIEALECSLSVPAKFPKERPLLRVTNSEMGRGYQLNVEAGFLSIVDARPNGTLLSWLNALDQQLESLLSKEKAETVKIVVNHKKPAEIHQPPERNVPQVRAAAAAAALPSTRSEAKKPSYTAAEKEAAQSRRDMDTRQLEARLGRLPQFAKSSDGLTYTLPIDPRKRGELPSSLESVKTLKLMVPRLYNLESCRIHLQGVTGQEVDAVQNAFEARCKERPSLSLMSHINFLAQNMHEMAKIEVNAAQMR